MSTTCLNCQNPITENFCANCGQKKFKRIDRKYLIEELQYTLLHTNKGFLYSIKHIIKNPGKTAREFIDGNRVNHYKPILLTFVLGTISTFINFKLLDTTKIFKEQFSQQNMGEVTNYMQKIMEFISHYNTFFFLLTLPFLAMASKLVFRKWGHNYFEHIVANCYFLAFYIIFTTAIITPISLLFMHNQSLYILVNLLSNLIIIFLLYWFFREFYKEKTSAEVIIKTIYLVLTFVALYLVFTICVGFAAAAYVITNNL